MRFVGHVKLSDLDPSNGYRISGEGEGCVAGFAKEGATIQLRDCRTGTLLILQSRCADGRKACSIGAASHRRDCKEVGRSVLRVTIHRRRARISHLWVLRKDTHTNMCLQSKRDKGSFSCPAASLARLVRYFEERNFFEVCASSTIRQLTSFSAQRIRSTDLIRLALNGVSARLIRKRKALSVLARPVSRRYEDVWLLAG